MKILLLAYACEPHAGSEPGTGWNTALHLAKAHAVTVITRANNRKPIEAALKEHAGSVPEFLYYDLPQVLVKLKKKILGIQLYYALWQIGLKRAISSMIDPEGFDVVHHLTFNSFEVPPFALGAVKARRIWGPVGGGQVTPSSLLGTLSGKARLKERVRGLRVFLSTWNPFVRSLFQQCDVVIFANQETRGRFSKLCRGDAGLMIDVGVSPDSFQPADRQHLEGGNILYAGRLEPRKGVRLLLEAFAKAAERDSGLTLSLVGGGPEEESLRERAEALGVAERVLWVGKVSHDEMRAQLSKADFFVFPSLRDTSGTIVLEALACGLPVICFDHQGGGIMVNDEVGTKIEPSGSGNVTSCWVEAILSFSRDRKRRLELGEKGPERVRKKFSWEKKVEALEVLYLSGPLD